MTRLLTVSVAVLLLSGCAPSAHRTLQALFEERYEQAESRLEAARRREEAEKAPVLFHYASGRYYLERPKLEKERFKNDTTLALQHFKKAKAAYAEDLSETDSVYTARYMIDFMHLQFMIDICEGGNIYDKRLRVQNEIDDLQQDVLELYDTIFVLRDSVRYYLNETSAYRDSIYGELRRNYRLMNDTLVNPDSIRTETPQYNRRQRTADRLQARAELLHARAERRALKAEKLKGRIRQLTTQLETELRIE